MIIVTLITNNDYHKKQQNQLISKKETINIFGLIYFVYIYIYSISKYISNKLLLEIGLDNYISLSYLQFHLFSA